MMTQLANEIQKTNCSTESKLPVGWIGDSQGGLKWLRCAVEQHCQVATIDLSDRLGPDDRTRLLESARANGLQRLIYSVNNRARLDSQISCQLQEIAGEIPFAIAGGSWIEGSRRTGMGETGALLLPWNRWWDGWHEWLLKPSESTLRAWTSATAHLTAPEQATQSAPPNGLIVADCQQTAIGWRASVTANSAGAVSPVDYVSSRSLPKWQGEPRWILLDDTAEFMCAEALDGPAEAACSLRKRFPDATLVIATTICRSDQWLPLQAMPNCETIAKPSTGRSLRNLLHHRFP